MNIIGVPQADGTWDVSWLGNEAGWLQGSAFPTWTGNSVLTGHIWNADNTPGPFSTINTLQWGDQIIIHAWSAQYVYEVRTVLLVSPSNINALMRHEELPWVTLVTCRSYDEASNSYRYRMLVRAVLIAVK
jgi:LPXTG-site transpeptidase (sortase) family protein